MQILLPPSETKREGGTGHPLVFEALSFASLTDTRRDLVAAVIELSADDEQAARALKLGSTSAAVELERNRTLLSSGTMPAIERYTGVLYDALDVRSLPAAARRRASASLVVHSALFGLLRADDPIPAYRLSHDSRLPARPLKRAWGGVISEALAELPTPIIDLRSAGYAALGALPERANAVGVSVVAVGDDGVARALNHFNKKGKGEWVRALLNAGALPRTITALCTRSTALGWPLRRIDERMLELIVPGTLPARASTR
ncbi:YaaA family protein [Microcella sp.]|uniref:YaaA family protein n=1 Tax=Microcella sp. TaxID=1913979 RepID=UPI00256A4AEF|nr:peroxide stress protein YaaA [Microcella sp.]MBX9471160.1 peroxide stress protein YaaA [Microcella sp.]